MSALFASSGAVAPVDLHASENASVRSLRVQAVPPAVPGGARTTAIGASAAAYVSPPGNWGETLTVISRFHRFQRKRAGYWLPACAFSAADRTRCGTS